MSIGPLNTISSIAASPITQATAADADRIVQEVNHRVREAAGQRAAERAEGIGVTEEEQAAGDRDADGRRIWEPTAKKSDELPGEVAANTAAVAKDPSGDRGSQLDLSG